MRYLTLILLFLSFKTFAQNSGIFRIDSMPTEGVGSAFVITLHQTIS